MLLHDLRLTCVCRSLLFVIRPEMSAAAVNENAEVAPEDGSSTGFAEALLKCPHAKRGIAALPRELPSTDCKCSKCSNPQENWICLNCYQPFCGRFANKHMLAHYNEHKLTQHCIALSTSDLGLWCYECDSYINHRKWGGHPLAWCDSTPYNELTLVCASCMCL
jgi:uncharacterized UBP type Zn finger protein